MKKFLSAVLAMCIMLSICGMCVCAQESMPITQMQTKDIITITVDGNFVDCSIYGQLPVIVDGRTLVPLRSVFEALGAEVSWNNEERSAVSVKGDVTVTLWVDSKEMAVNRVIKTLDVPPQIMNERTMVPVRAVAEAFGAKVDWNNDTRTVVIETQSEKSQEAETPEEVVEKAFEAVFNLDFEKANQYFVNTDSFSEGDALPMFSLDGVSPEQAEVVKAFLAEILDTIKIRIDGCEINGDRAIVKIVTIAPDFEKVNIEQSFDMAEVEAQITQALEEKGYTLEMLNTITDEAELQVIASITTSVSAMYILEAFNEQLKTVEIVTEADEVKLINKDGKWLIVE